MKTMTEAGIAPVGMGCASQITSPVLMLIDLQRDLCYDSRRNHLFRSALPYYEKTIEAFQGHGHPVVLTKFELDLDDDQFQRFGDRYCVKGTPGAEFVDEIAVYAKEVESHGLVVKKLKHSAFYETDLEDRLREHGVETIVLGGLQTQICVLTTAADAYNRGFKVVAAREVLISTRNEAKLDALEWIEKYVGEVHSVDDILRVL
ncbi:MAG: cysteine hydrolase [Micrococcales bacterium]|nr:cysteine hydrolase [Micrococcales bacterium]MCL2668926.1 cysteine hydrolase [Micrococcales bacterium]